MQYVVQATSFYKPCSVIRNVNDSLRLVQPLLHRQNDISDFLKARRNFFLMLDLARCNERRKDFIKFIVVLSFESNYNKSVQREGVGKDLNQMLKEFPQYAEPLSVTAQSDWTHGKRRVKAGVISRNHSAFLRVYWVTCSVDGKAAYDESAVQVRCLKSVI